MITEEKVYSLLETLNKSYDKYHNRTVTRKRIRKLMKVKTKSREVTEVCQYLHKLEIFEPYYDNEPIDQTKVWKIVIDKLKKYLEEKGPMS